MSNLDTGEILKIDKQKEILDKVVTYLSKSNPSLYYETTMTIAEEIRRVIDSESLLRREEKELVVALTSHDIQALLSYSCCD